MKELLEEFFKLSDKVRPNYSKSLGKSSGLPLITKFDVNSYPLFLDTIYTSVQGTLRDIEDQKLMDFIPGYYLIHESQLEDSLKIQNKILDGFSSKKLIPFLANYSSDFISIDINTGQIYYVYHDEDEIYLAYNKPLDFFKTIIEHYKRNVFFLDEDGYLDYDEDLESEIASKINPNIEFWKE